MLFNIRRCLLCIWEPLTSYQLSREMKFMNRLSLPALSARSSRFHFRAIQVALVVLLGCANGFADPQAASEKTSGDRSPNIVLIVIDTLGAKHVGSSPGQTAATPNLNALAARGANFSQAFSTAPWTKASLASLFTSLYPSQHRTTALRSAFQPPVPTLAETLKSAGYKTAGFVSHTLIGPKTGYAKGFDYYDIVSFKGNIHDAITSEQVSDFGVKWLADNGKKASQPLFLFLHYFDPHYNYQHHPRYDRSSWYQGPIKPGLGFRHLRDMFSRLTESDFRALGNLYEEEIAYTDSEIGRFLNYLESSGLGKNTAVIVTADHGEEFNEHGGIGHTRTLYNELVHVPLYIVGPGIPANQEIRTPVSNIDIFPSAAAIAGLKALPAGLQGKSLFDELKNGLINAPERPLMMEVDFRSEGVKAHKVGCLKGRHKIVLDKESQQWELYDLLSDPEEKKDLYASSPTIAADLKTIVENYRKQFGNSDRAEKEAEKDQTQGKTPEEIEQLRTLGYL